MVFVIFRLHTYIHKIFVFVLWVYKKTSFLCGLTARFEGGVVVVYPPQQFRVLRYITMASKVTFNCFALFLSDKFALLFLVLDVFPLCFGFWLI